MVKPDPPASLADTREAVERMDARGNTLVPVDPEQVEGMIWTWWTPASSRSRSR